MKIRLMTAGLLALGLCACTGTLEEEAARIHKAAYTVDSHTDTPLSLGEEGYDFGRRNDPVETGTKIDLVRMEEGGMDAIWFGVFVGQARRDEAGNARAKARADEVTGLVYSTVGKYPDQLEVATRAADLKRIADVGKHAIYIGMENGYPIGRELELLDEYYKKGVRYLTLVHTGNNDICDSSNDSIEHGGLSPFGEQVVARMNDLGMIIDLSHASDQSVEDVLALTRVPVIASHSGAKAICDNPRNLSDELLLKIRDNGGVVQMVAYSGYIRDIRQDPARDSARQEIISRHGRYNELDEAGKKAFFADWREVDRKFPQKLATVSDMVDHIDHMVEVMGIDHVGIGTDFDGGGALEDCFDVSQMGNITLELLRREYSEEDIFKIWGGNFTRVFEAVEQGAL